MPGGRGKKLKDQVPRSQLYSMRLPADLRSWIQNEAANRTLSTGRQVSSADIVIEALREKRTRGIWRRIKGGA